MEEINKQIPEWLNKETAKLESQKEQLKFPEPLILKQGTLAEIEVDFSNEFESYVDESNQSTKAIIPVKENGIAKTWWLNKRNPVYADLIRKGRNGQRKFKIATMGEKKSTRYSFVENNTPQTLIGG